jgi:hypothetical protein
MSEKQNNIKYNIKPLLIAMGILLLFILSYGFYLMSKSKVDIGDTNKQKSAEETGLSPERKELEEKTQNAADALNEMREEERKVPTIMDYQRASIKEQAAEAALDQMRKNDASPSSPSAGQEVTAEERAVKEQAASDALKQMRGQ